MQGDRTRVAHSSALDSPLPLSLPSLQSGEYTEARELMRLLDECRLADFTCAIFPQRSSHPVDVRAHGQGSMVLSDLFVVSLHRESEG